MPGSFAVALMIPGSAFSLPRHNAPRTCICGHRGGGHFSPPHAGCLQLNASRQHSSPQYGSFVGCGASLGGVAEVGIGNGASSTLPSAAVRPLSAAPLSQNCLTLAEAASDEELRAASYLRARTFYTYPHGRSADGILAHRRMKAEDDWRALVAKVTGTEESYGRVICLIALAKISSFQLGMSSDLQTSCKVGTDSIVVGSLDLNQGLRLPGEISGDQPSGLEAKTQRGYLSNVCVAEEYRRKGVAKALIARAETAAQQWGITNLYVHVVFDNVSAQNLYAKLGYEYEREESLSSSSRETRPRRLLLHKCIPKGQLMTFAH